MKTQEEHDAEHMKHGFPFCDGCGHSAVWSEFDGWMHSTPAYPFGDYEDARTTDHEITTRKWAHERYGDPLD